MSRWNEPGFSSSPVLACLAVLLPFSGMALAQAPALPDETVAMNEIASAASHSLSFLGLFLQADPIVKGVMILLVLASLACWTIIVEKILRIRLVRRQACTFETAARSGDRLHPQIAGTTGRIRQHHRHFRNSNFPSS